MTPARASEKRARAIRIAVKVAAVYVLQMGVFVAVRLGVNGIIDRDGLQSWHAPTALALVGIATLAGIVYLVVLSVRETKRSLEALEAGPLVNADIFS